MHAEGVHTPTEPNVEKTWLEFIQGSKNAFSWIYHHFFNDLYNYAYRFTPEEALAKDTVQELFVDLWEKRSRLPPVNAVKPYLFKALRNRVLNTLKKTHKNYTSLDFSAAHWSTICFSQEDFVVEEEQQAFRKRLIADVLNQLPERRKEAVYLRYFRNLSYEEIATIMSLSEKAVINHIYKAFKSLRKNDALKNFVRLLTLAHLSTASISMLYLEAI